MSLVTVINPAVIAAGNAQDIKADITKFDVAQQQVNQMVALLLPLYTITSDQQLEVAMATLKDAKKVDSAIEEKRKTLVKPFNDGATQINDYKKTLVAGLAAGIEKVKTAVLTYQQDREKKAKEVRAKSRQDQLVQLGFTFNAGRWDLKDVGGCSMMEINSYEDVSWNSVISSFVTAIGQLRVKELQELSVQKDMVEAFGSDEDKQQLTETINAVAAPIAAPTAAYSSAPSKVKGQTKRWTFEVTNALAVPREYLMVNSVLIREAIRSGVHDIPGVKIFQEDGLSIR
jgi:hypothetical protein